MPWITPDHGCEIIPVWMRMKEGRREWVLVRAAHILHLFRTIVTCPSPSYPMQLWISIVSIRTPWAVRHHEQCYYCKSYIHWHNCIHSVAKSIPPPPIFDVECRVNMPTDHHNYSKYFRWMFVSMRNKNQEREHKPNAPSYWFHLHLQSRSLEHTFFKFSATETVRRNFKRNECHFSDEIAFSLYFRSKRLISDWVGNYKWDKSKWYTNSAHFFSPNIGYQLLPLCHQCIHLFIYCGEIVDAGYSYTRKCDQPNDECCWIDARGLCAKLWLHFSCKYLSC